MNKNKVVAVMLLFIVMSFSSFAQDDVAKQNEIKKNVVEAYMAIKGSLINSDSIKARSNANNFVATLKTLRFKKLHYEEMNMAVTARTDMVQLATEIGATNNINVQREKFAALSETIWTVAGMIKPADLTLYQQKCPMTGVTWISEEKAIKNPYYPKNMLTCGEVKASL